MISFKIVFKNQTWKPYILFQENKGAENNNIRNLWCHITSFPCHGTAVPCHGSTVPPDTWKIDCCIGLLSALGIGILAVSPFATNIGRKWACLLADHIIKEAPLSWSPQICNQNWLASWRIAKENSVRLFLSSIKASKSISFVSCDGVSVRMKLIFWSGVVLCNSCK
jgi:hypothetical protein